MAKMVESLDSAKADVFLEAAHADNKLLESAYWIIDLQIPEAKREIEDMSEEQEED